MGVNPHQEKEKNVVDMCREFDVAKSVDLFTDRMVRTCRATAFPKKAALSDVEDDLGYLMEAALTPASAGKIPVPVPQSAAECCIL